MGIHHSRRPKLVEFLYDRTVSSPADVAGTKGEVKMMPEQLAKKLCGLGYGRLTADVVQVKDLEVKADEPEKLDDQIVQKLVDVGFARADKIEINDVCEKIVNRLMKQYATTADLEKLRKEIKKHVTGEKGTTKQPDGGADNSSGDSGKTRAVPDRKRRNGVDTSAGGS